jgi:hypothetical protein
MLRIEMLVVDAWLFQVSSLWRFHWMVTVKCHLRRTLRWADLVGAGQRGLHARGPFLGGLLCKRVGAAGLGRVHYSSSR